MLLSLIFDRQVQLGYVNVDRLAAKKPRTSLMLCVRPECPKKIEEGELGDPTARADLRNRPVAAKSVLGQRHMTGEQVFDFAETNIDVHREYPARRRGRIGKLSHMRSISRPV